MGRELRACGFAVDSFAVEGFVDGSWVGLFPVWQARHASRSARGPEIWAGGLVKGATGLTN